MTEVSLENPKTSIEDTSSQPQPDTIPQSQKSFKKGEQSSTLSEQHQATALASAPTTFQGLPPEILTLILQQVDLADIDRIALASRTLRHYVLDLEVLRKAYLNLSARPDQPAQRDFPKLNCGSLTHWICNACEVSRPWDILSYIFMPRVMRETCYWCRAKWRWAQGSPRGDLLSPSRDLLWQHCTMKTMIRKHWAEGKIITIGRWYWFFCPGCRVVKVMKDLEDDDIKSFADEQAAGTAMCKECSRGHDRRAMTDSLAGQHDQDSIMTEHS